MTIPPLPRNPAAKPDLDEWLDKVSVLAPGMWENDTGPKDWYAVCDDDGIFAYFRDETDAFRCRLDYINRQLNPTVLRPTGHVPGCGLEETFDMDANNPG